MTNIVLEAKPRKLIGKKVIKVRQSGNIPCVTYGHGIKTINLEIDQRAFEDAFEKAGTSTVVELKIDSKKTNVIIHDIQRDVISGKIIHADLYQIKMDEKIKAEVPIKFIGVSKAVKDLGGILVKAMDHLAVEALPKDLPREIIVDISKLDNLGDKILLKSLDLPQEVQVLVEDKELSLVSVDEPRSEEELKKLDEEVSEDVEAVEGVKKEVEGEEVTEETGEKATEGAAKTDKPAAEKATGAKATETTKQEKK